MVDDFSMPDANATEGLLLASQKRYKDYVALQDILEKRTAKSISTPSTRTTTRLTAVQTALANFNYTKGERKRIVVLADQAKLEREITQRIDKALGRVISWIQAC